MKKRILSIMLLCCMVLTMLPTTVLAADGPMDTIPKYDVSIDVYNRTSDISIKDSRSYYIYSSVPDKLRDTWLSLCLSAVVQPLVQPLLPARKSTTDN